MEEATKKEIVDICRDAYKKPHDGDYKYYKDLAFYIKKEIEKKNAGAWHIIVGKIKLLI